MTKLSFCSNLMQTDRQTDRVAEPKRDWDHDRDRYTSQCPFWTLHTGGYYQTKAVFCCIYYTCTSFYLPLTQMDEASRKEVTSSGHGFSWTRLVTGKMHCCRPEQASSIFDITSVVHPMCPYSTFEHLPACMRPYLADVINRTSSAPQVTLNDSDRQYSPASLKENNTHTRLWLV